MKKISWLDCLESYFMSSGLDYKDMYWIIKKSITEKRITFPDFINKASNGFGFTIHEELSYSLDQNWDFPNEFDKVCFHFGEMDESNENSVSINEFVLLMEIAVRAYAHSFPEDRERVFCLFDKLKKRYWNKNKGDFRDEYPHDERDA